MATTKDGGKIIGYGTYGDVCGFGQAYASEAEAESDLREHTKGCARQGGYSDREVVAIEEGGYCWRLSYGENVYGEPTNEVTSNWIRNSSGSAVRYAASDIEFGECR